MGNFILGTTVFNTEEEPDGCLRVSGHLKETHIVLVNTQGRRTRGGCGCFNTHTFLSERVQHFLQIYSGNREEPDTTSVKFADDYKS